jgi:quinol monooxygenase YgiN
MSQEVLSIAVFEPYPGEEEPCLATVRELIAILAAKNYSRDLVYRDRANPKIYVLVRYWTSPAARREAQEDPAVQKCWARLGHQMTILNVYESLDEVNL